MQAPIISLDEGWTRLHKNGVLKIEDNNVRARVENLLDLSGVVARAKQERAVRFHTDLR